MSLKRNAIANYIGAIYTAIIGIVVLPLYLDELGPEAFGLIGFFTLMQAWFNLLDFGLSSAFAREVASTRGLNNNFIKIKKLLKSIELILGAIAVSIAVIIYNSSMWLSVSWMTVEYLNLDTVAHCFTLMGIIFGLRLLSSLYRSAISSMEHQVWLNIVSVTLLTIRFVGAWLCLHYLHFDILAFFYYQIVVSSVELSLLAFYFYRIMPNDSIKASPNLSVVSIKTVLPYSLSIAYAAVLWVIATQLDKIILSNTLLLSEYAYFSLVIILAAGVMQLSNPISEAVLPRLTGLYSQKNREQLVLLYRWSAQVISVVVLSTALMVAFFSQELLFAWTGNKELAFWGKDILYWFVLGNGILAISAVQYSLQRAICKMRLYVIGATVSAIIQIPIIYYAATNHGAYGVAISWFSFRVCWFFIWTAIVHSKYLPCFHFSWLIRDIAPIAFTSYAVVFSFKYLIPVSLGETRLSIFVQLSILGLCTLSIVALSSSLLRQRFLNFIHKPELK